MSDKPTIGLIGAGLMGHGIGKNLVEAGYQLQVYAHRNRTPIEDLVSRGASEAQSIKELATSVDVIITCLPSIPAVHAVFDGPDGLLETVKEGGIIVDCTTSDPSLTKELGTKADARGITLLDAPLLRGPKNAWEGTIQLVVGGDKAKIDECRPIFDAVAEDVIYAGDLGSGHAIKLINNGVTLAQQAILCESFTVGQKLGIDLETIYKVLDTSNASSKKLHDVAPRLINNNHSMAFAVDTAFKDVRLFNKLADDAGVPTPTASGSKNLFEVVSGMGYGDKNISEIAIALAKLSGTEFDD